MPGKFRDAVGQRYLRESAVVDMIFFGAGIGLPREEPILIERKRKMNRAGSRGFACWSETPERTGCECGGAGSAGADKVAPGESVLPCKIEVHD